MNPLRQRNIDQLEHMYSTLFTAYNGDTVSVAEQDKVVTPTYTKKQLATAMGVNDDRIQTVMDRLERDENEYYARDARNWLSLTREQALRILAEFNVKTVQDKRALDPQNYETPVIFVNKNKGGVGKSTTALHLAVEAALDVKKNRRVLLADGDIQGSVRHYLSPPELVDGSFYSVSELVKENANLSREERLSPEKQSEYREYLLDKVVLPSRVDNLWFIPSILTDIEMSITLASELGAGDGSQEERLARSLSVMNDVVFQPLKQDFELMIIDSGPSPDPLVYNLLYASNHAIIPTTGRRQDFRAFLQHLQLNKLLLEGLLPSDYKGLYSLKALIVKHQKKDELETVANQIAAAGHCYAARIMESKKYEEAAIEKLPLQLLKTKRTEALTDALNP